MNLCASTPFYLVTFDVTGGGAGFQLFGRTYKWRVSFRAASIHHCNAPAHVGR